MDEQLSFIETQFPVSKISKESYKERRAGSAQTLTPFGKWWGRKPTILVRAAILGCLLPSSNDSQKDRDCFLALLTMDNDGLSLRKKKRISIKDMYAVISNSSSLSKKYLTYFINNNGKIELVDNEKRDEIEDAVFDTLTYDQKLAYCVRPEEVNKIPASSWKMINEHYGTHADNIRDFITETSKSRFNNAATIGDCFCGGGSIPFEAARIGCRSIGSDLNPIAALLTWSAIKLSSLSQKQIREIASVQNNIYKNAQKKIDRINIETNKDGTRDFAYLYCVEAKCPECGADVPLASTWVIGKGTRTVAKLEIDGKKINISVKMNASKEEMEEAENSGTVVKNGLRCPCCGKIRVNHF